MITYHKLIRDKIPEIIASTGKEYNVTKLEQADYQQALKLKLIEESQEVFRAEGKESLEEEIADVYEVIEALIDSYNLDVNQITKKQKQKAEKRGKFTKKLKLISVEEPLISVKHLPDSEQKLLEQLEQYLHDKVSPQANIIDNDASTLNKIVQEIKKTQPDLFRLKLSRQWGGIEISKLGFYLWQTMIAKYSGALAFLQTQHQSAVSMLCQSENKIAQEKYLPPIFNNCELYGLGFSHLRRQGKPTLKAIPVTGGYQLTGNIPWITGYGFFSHFIVGATLPNGEEFYGITALKTDQKQGKIELSKPLNLSALNSTNTVTAQLNQWFISEEDVIMIKPPSAIHQRDKQNILHHGFFPLGCCQAALEICVNNNQKLNLIEVNEAINLLIAEFDSLWQKMFTAVTENTYSEQDKLRLRVSVINLLYRCVSSAVITSKGAANGLHHPANRLYREALVYGVSGQTIPFLANYFKFI